MTQPALSEEILRLLPGLAKVLEGTATDAETLQVLNDGLTVLAAVDKPIAGKVAMVQGLIRAYESYGPGGPFAPAPEGPDVKRRGG